MNNERPGKTENPQKAWWEPAMVLFFKFSGWIIIPPLAGVYFGRWLDRKYNTGPWFFLISVGAAFLLSMAGLISNVMKEYRRIEQETSEKRREPRLR